MPVAVLAVPVSVLAVLQASGPSNLFNLCACAYVLVCVCTSCVRLCTGAVGAQEVGEAYAGPDGDPEVAMPQQNPLKPPALRVHDIFGPRRLSIPRSLVNQLEPNRRAGARV